MTKPRVFVYSWRDFDEAPLFEKYAKELGFELGFTEALPSFENLDLLKGYEYVSVLTTPIDAGMLDRMKELGVKMVCTRTIGYNHIDVDHAKSIGMVVTNITYDPTGVAEYTVMMMLMAIRKLRAIGERGAINDFSLKGLLGKELKNCTVGIIGAGQIGTTVLRILSGFGCRLLYSNRREKEEASELAEYVPMDDLLAQSDIVSLHLELNPETEHMFGKEQFSKMKKDAYFVNTSRGPLVDTAALVEAVESGTIAGAAVDVIENEFDMCYYNRSGYDYRNPVLESVRSTPGIIHTHHMAFYYEDAIRDMVYNCLHGMRMLEDGEEVPHRIA